MTISDHGYWQGTDIRSRHCDDAYLADALTSFFRGKTVLDLGCGTGYYVSALRKAGIFAEGVDGNPATPELSDGQCLVFDLADDTKPLPTELQRAQWVLSLEVGEHLPPAYSAAFLNNVTRFASEGVLLSWALPGQGGYGHFNEQDNGWVEREMRIRRFGRDLLAERTLRRSSSLGWFQGTLMVYTRLVQSSNANDG